MKGRWAAGIVPRNFVWIVKDRLAVSERPGGYAPHHRRVRRHEEILWLRGQGFNRIVSLLPSSHNLHAYEELGLPSSHFPLPAHGDLREVLGELYPALLGWLADGERILVHQEELGERIAGVIAGFLCWSGALPEPPRAVSVVENLLRRQMGSAGRSVVAVSLEVPPPPDHVEATLRPVRSAPEEAPDAAPGEGPDQEGEVLAHPRTAIPETDSHPTADSQEGSAGPSQ